MIVAPVRHRAVRLVAVGALVAAVVGAAAPASQAIDVPIFPGSLPDSSSAVTVSGQGLLSDFAVHVNQTKNLTSQGVSLSWSWPGRSTVKGYSVGTGLAAGGGSVATSLGNYVQVMQCWGNAVTQADVDAAPAATKAQVQANFVATNQGPPREQCEYGGTAQRSATSNGQLPNLTTPVQDSRSAGAAVPSGQSAKYYGDETVYPSTPYSYFNYPEVPFKAADGTVTPNSDPKLAGWSNNYFGSATTNELNYGQVSDGTGGATFQAQNSLDAPGLGCGVENAAGTGLNTCWLVVVPRLPQSAPGGKEYRTNQNVIENTTTARSVLSGPLASTIWADRIAIPLDFRPTLDACANASSNYLTVGSALPQNALLSWQAALCRGGNGSAGYTYTYTPDSIARQDLSSGSSSMRLLSNPVPTDQAFDPTTYAPLTLSGVSVSFVFEPATNLDKNPFSPPEITVNLNQRLVAKALTQSYVSANPWRITPIADGKPPVSDYGWLDGNPNSIWQDPEFWALNPDIVAAYPQITSTSYNTGVGANGYLQVNGTGSDAYAAVWKWLLADKATRVFLSGRSDEHGMNVDPYYSTNPDINPTGAAFDPSSLDYFPILDPWLGDPFGYATTERCGGYPQPNNPVVGSVDLAPYAPSLQAVARNIVRVDPLNKAVNYNCAGPNGTTTPFSDLPAGWYSAYAPTTPGQHKMLGLTDTASSAQYGVATANLQNADGKFVGPTTAGMQAAAAHLSYTGGVQGVGQPDPSNTDPAAYPLSLITYGAVQTNQMDDAACSAYASLLDYGASQGQTQGADVGQLPLGYAPLPPTLKAQAAAAARTVAACAKVPEPATPSEAQPAPETAAPAADAPAADAPVTDAPAEVAAPSQQTAAPASAPPVSLASNRGTTKPDPSVFAWVIPIALLVGFLSVLLAPAAGLRRRRADPPPGRGSG